MFSDFQVYKDTLCLAFENSEVLLSICLRECLTSKQKSDLIVEMLQYIKPVFNISYRGTTVGLTQTVSLITSISKGDSDQQRETCLRTVSFNYNQIHSYLIIALPFIRRAKCLTTSNNITIKIIKMIINIYLAKD